MSEEAGTGTPAGTVELVVPARPESLALVRLALGAVAGVAEAPADAVADLKLAATEACTNVVQHAYPDRGDGDGHITVRFSLEARTFTVEVCDLGVGFDPERVPDVLTPDGERERGMGIPIIRAVTDTVVIASNGEGTRVVFAKGLVEA